MPGIKIIADEKIPFLKQYFLGIGTLSTLSASEINSKKIKNYDILLVRSVTKVNKELLENTRIKIVGSMTSGIDHIDRNYLRNNGIKLFYAPGSNANSVAEYIIACLLILAKKQGFSLNKKTIGIIGVGNVGKRVALMCRALGIDVLLNDPPKFNRTKNKELLSFNKISDADIITIHVPLTFTGKYRTYRMIDEKFMKKIKKNTILINTSRGAVIDESMLLKYAYKLSGLVLDVWDNEPYINTHLLEIADIATPHIAGYSLDGKFNATTMVCKKLCNYLGKELDIKKQKFNLDLNKKIILDTNYHKLQDIIYQAVLKIYNPLADSKKLKKLLKFETKKQTEHFRRLRDNYRVRREFSNYVVKLGKKIPIDYKKAAEILTALGFKVKP